MTKSLPNTSVGCLQQAYQTLKSTENPRLDAELLLAHVLKIPRTHLLIWPERIVTTSENQQLQQLLQRRLSGESIAHIFGEKEFWSLTLQVTHDTLIPRPDTELLVELVLEKLDKNPVQTVADLGTGSGAIALAIAKERPHWQIIATDNYPATLAVAKRNADRLALTNICFYEGDWCAALPPQLFSAIVSNPPYIAADDPHLMTPNLSFEPRHALVGGDDGLRDLYCIIDQAKTHLAPGGWLLLEHGFDQASFVYQQMQIAGYKDGSTHHDLAGHPRVTMGHL